MFDINPIEYVKDCQVNQCFLFLGEHDEMIMKPNFKKMFDFFNSQKKELKIFNGCHNDERDNWILTEAFFFIKMNK